MTPRPPRESPFYARSLGATPHIEEQGAAEARGPSGQLCLGPASKSVRLLGHLVHSGGLPLERVPLNPDWILGDTFQNPPPGTVLLQSYPLLRGWFHFMVGLASNCSFDLRFRLVQGSDWRINWPIYVTAQTPPVIRLPGPLPLEFDNRVQLVQNSAGVIGLVTVSLHLRQVL